MKKLSHAYIISCASAEAGLEEALKLAKTALCSGREDNTFCGLCKNCVKIDRKVHPDLIFVPPLEDENQKKEKESKKADKEESKKTKKNTELITVDEIRAIVSDAYILPNEAAGKVYIIRKAENMNVQAQNALLKVLEEPPAHVMILLTTNNAERLLTTVRSRCVEIKVHRAEPDPIPQNICEAAETYIRLVAEKDTLGLCKFCEGHNTYKSEDMNAFARAVTVLVADVMSGRRNDCAMSPKALGHVERLMEKCLEYLKVNVNVKSLFGLLEVDSIQ